MLSKYSFFCLTCILSHLNNALFLDVRKLGKCKKITWEKNYFRWTRGGGGFPQMWISYGDKMNI